MLHAGTERGQPPESPRDEEDGELYDQLCAFIEVREALLLHQGLLFESRSSVVYFVIWLAHFFLVDRVVTYPSLHVLIVVGSRHDRLSGNFAGQAAPTHQVVAVYTKSLSGVSTTHAPRNVLVCLKSSPAPSAFDDNFSAPSTERISVPPIVRCRSANQPKLMTAG